MCNQVPICVYENAATLPNVMTYSESAQGQTISQRRAIQELDAHGMGNVDDVTEFLNDLGDVPTYNASEVLEWLGY